MFNIKYLADQRSLVLPEFSLSAFVSLDIVFMFTHWRPIGTIVKCKSTKKCTGVKPGDRWTMVVASTARMLRSTPCHHTFVDLETVPHSYFGFLSVSDICHLLLIPVAKIVKVPGRSLEATFTAIRSRVQFVSYSEYVVAVGPTLAAVEARRE